MRLFLFLFVCIWSLGSIAQGPMQLSLVQALELAGKQSYAVQHSTLEAEKAVQRLKEITGLGLPQINASAGFQDFLDIPVSVSEDIFGGTGQLLEFQFGLQYAGSAGVQLDQLIFDGSYLVALKASRAYRKNKAEELEQTILEAKTAAAKAYYAVLIANEAATNLLELIPVLEENVRQAKGLFDNGFADETDVQRQELGLSEVRNQLSQLQNQKSSALDMLHFVLGIPLATPLELSDGLDEVLVGLDARAFAQTSFDPDTHVDGRVAASSLLLQDLAVKNERSSAYPKLYGFVSHQQNAYRQQFDFFGSGEWYPTTVVGVNLQVPIFSGGVRSKKLKQAKITLDQVEMNQGVVREQLLLDHAQKRKTVLSAADRLDNAQSNLELAEKIFEHVNKKFREGLVTSFELTQERAQLINSQNEYTQSLADLLLARADLREALGAF